MDVEKMNSEEAEREIQEHHSLLLSLWNRGQNDTTIYLVFVAGNVTERQLR